MTPGTLAASKLLAACSLFALASSAWAEQAPEPADARVRLDSSHAKASAYRGRYEGDLAMNGRDYAVAASFYAEYRAAAAKADDRASLKDAFERQIDALILANLPDQASNALVEFGKAFPQLDDDSIGMWKADILTLKGSYKEAIALLEPILERLPARDPRRIRALSSLAVALEGAGQIARAAELYASIQEEAGDGSPFQKGALAKEILCLVSSGQFEKARERVKLAQKSKNAQANADDFKILSLLLDLKESGPGTAENSYSQARMKLKDGPHPLAYRLACAFGDAWIQDGQLNKALDCYRDAFAFAPTRIDACDSAKRLMDCMNALGLKAEAADFAMRHFELFIGVGARSDMKLQAARLLAGAGRLNDAASLYKQLAAESPASSPIRAAAAKECARVQLEMKDFDGAVATLKRFFDTPALAGERDYLLAELATKAGRFQESAEAYMQVAARHPKFREKALYEAMISYEETRDVAKALSVAETLLKEFPGGASAMDALYQRARVYEMAGELGKACEEYVKFADAYRDVAELAARALYRAARLDFLLGRQKDAEKLLSEILTRYPASPLAPAASYWRIQCYYSAGDELSAERETWLLVERHPDSEFAVAALFSLAGNYADAKLPERAEAALNRISALPKASSDAKARALMEKMSIKLRSGDAEGATKLFAELNEKHQDSAVLSDAMYLYADMLRERGDYEQAKTFYRKVMERRPNSLLELAAAGGQADCVFSLSAPTKDKEQLEQALRLYKGVAARENAPSLFKAMSLYKAGRCLETLGDLKGALELYKKLLYKTRISARLGEEPDSVWTAKAANAIVAGSIKLGSPEDFRAAAEALNWLGRAGLLQEKALKARFAELDRLKTAAPPKSSSQNTVEN